MKRIFLGALGLSILISNSVLASDSAFPCPSVDMLANSANNAVIYAPLTSGMPANLMGSAYGVSNEGWIGMVIGTTYASIDYTKSSFLSLYVGGSSGPLNCSYSIVGAASNGNPISQQVVLTPGNINYPSLYNYSLTGGGNSSTDISVNIIAS